MKWSIPSKIIEEGRQLVNENRVLSIVPDESHQVWRSEVLDDKDYYISLDGTGKEDDICHCDFWYQHHYCVHTVAVELFLRAHDVVRAMAFSKHPLFRYPKLSERPSQRLDQLYNGFMSHRLLSFKDSNEATITPLKLRFDICYYDTEPYRLSTRGLFCLRLHIGIRTLYYVNNLDQFFEAFLSESIYEINASNPLKVWLTKKAFNPEEYEVLTYLATHAVLRDEWMTTTLHVPETQKNQQPYYLSKSEFEELIQLYQKETHDIRFIIKDEQCYPKIQTKRPSLFELARHDENYVLIMENRTMWYRYYHYIYDGEDLYQINADDDYFDNIQALHNQLAQEQYQLELPPEEMYQFFSLFGRLLLQHTLVTNIVYLPFVEPVPPLTVQVTFDVFQSTLSVSVVYDYDHYTISDDPTQTQLPSKKILLRDLSAELSVENHLIKLGFRHEGNQYSQKYSDFNQTMLALENTLKWLPADWQVNYTKRLSSWVGEADKLTVSTEPTRSNRFFKINFGMEGMTSEEVDQVIEAITKDETFYQLDNGRIVNLKHIVTPEQNRMLHQLRQHQHQWKNGQSIPIYQSLRYAPVLEGQFTFEKFYEDLIHPASASYQVNPKLNAVLADYQVYAVQWLNVLAKYQLGGLLADEMGLGKTIQTIAFILDYLDHYPNSKIIILLPASVLYNWQHEFSRFAPTLNVVVIDGSAEERQNIRKTHTDSIWLTSYSGYRNDQKDYHAQYFDLMVLDEAQSLKNERTTLYQTVIKQKSGIRLGLSGTPLENNILEFWALMQIILPGLFPNKKAFKQMSLDNIRKIASPFVLRRTKKDVRLELPEKEVYDRFATLEHNQKVMYLAYLKEIQQRLKQGEKYPAQLRIEMLAAITRLRQICCHPKLVDSTFEGTSGKFEYFKDMLNKALNNKRKILVFSQFTQMLAIMEEYLKSKDIPYLTITGKTSKKARQEHVDRFNTSDVPVFLISLRAGGVGLNLTGADTVFLFDLWWNPSVEEQAIGRAHRIGQTKDVQVYRLITEGTIEERIAELQQEKRELFDQLFDEEDMRESKHLSLDDLYYILAINDDKKVD